VNLVALGGVDELDIDFVLVNLVVMVVAVVVHVVAAFETVAVAGAQHTSVHGLGCDSLKIISPTDTTHEVNEHHGQVNLPAQLAGPVIVGEGVVVVVPAFADGAQATSLFSDGLMFLS